jgi:lycopene cyclase domain-containing protein
MLIFTLFGSLWLEFFFRLSVFKQFKRLMLTIFPFATLYIGWDAFATHFKDWGFDPKQTINIKPVLNLPIEEISFFLIVPSAAILTIEAVLHVKKNWKV